MNRPQISKLLVVLSCTALLSGCDSDDGNTTSNDGPGSAARPEPIAPVAEDSSGPAGSGPADDGSMTGVPEAEAGPEEVVCGGKTCQTPPLDTPLCCTTVGAGRPGDPAELTGRAPDLCGTDLGDFVAQLRGVCLQLDQPGELDSLCPPIDLGGGNVQAGCCTDEGRCAGLDLGAGLGCVYPGSGKGAICGPQLGDAGVGEGGLPSPVSCGGRSCGPSPLGTPLCCTGAGAGVEGDPLRFAGRSPELCGTDLGVFVPELAGICLQLDQPGARDPACPDVPQDDGDVQVGCCTDEGRCGSLEVDVGLGCVYSGDQRGPACGG